MICKAQSLQEAMLSTISHLFGGDCRDICEVKRAVVQIEAVYLCHSCCRLLGRCGPTLLEELELYRDYGLLPGSTVKFYLSHVNAIERYFPDESAFETAPELLYEELLAQELYISKTGVQFHTDKVTRDLAGAYYTSAEFAFQITRRALDAYLEKETGIQGYSFSASREENLYLVTKVFSRTFFVDYSCGCGEFLLAVMRYFDQYLPEYPVQKLLCRLVGIDVDPIAIMIAVTRLLRQAGPSALPEAVFGHFLVGNPLLCAAENAGLEERFENFALNRLYAPDEGIELIIPDSGKIILLGNPPWEKLRFEERTFFRMYEPKIAEISQKDKRAEQIRQLSWQWPELLDYYTLLQNDYLALKKTIPRNPFLEHSLSGELNTYALFAELAAGLIGRDGFAGIIVKSALVTSPCYAPLFRSFVEQGILSEVFLYSNQERLFPIDSREKFCVVFFHRAQRAAFRVHCGLVRQEELFTSEPILVSYDQLKLLNPDTALLPNAADAETFDFLLRMHNRFPVFAEVYPHCHFGRLIHLTAHARHISTEPSDDRVPIYEGKFIEQYDNRFSTFAGLPKSARYRAKASAKKQPEDPCLKQKPLPECRYFVERSFWESFLARYDQPYSLCWRSLTSPTNQRTMIATILPTMPTCQSIQLLQTPSRRELLLLLALFNSKVFDYFVRAKMSGLDLTQSVVRQIPVPPLSLWEGPVYIGEKAYPAAQAILMLEKLLYRNEPTLAELWEGIPDLEDSALRYTNGPELRSELDRIFFKLYRLSEREELLVLSIFST